MFSSQMAMPRLLAASCVLLAGLVCVEVWPASPGHKSWPATARLLARAGVAAPPRHSADALARDILARPLFASLRRPPAQELARVAAGTVLPRLSGIVVAGAYRRAIFERSGKASILAVGDRVDKDRVVAISADAVILGEGGHDQTIRPGYDPARQSSAYTPATGLSILDRLNLHQTPFVPLPRPPSMQQMMQRLAPHQ